jgi:hypothetical protein
MAHHCDPGWVATEIPNIFQYPAHRAGHILDVGRMLHVGRQAVIDRDVDVALGREIARLVDTHIPVGLAAVRPAPAVDHQQDRQINCTVRRVDIQAEEVRGDIGDRCIGDI